MPTPERDRPILVPVANPSSIGPLLRHAAALAGRDGEVHLLTVVGEGADADAHAHAWQGLTEAERTAHELGVHARGQVRTASDVETGVLAAIAETDPGLVVLGWRGRSSTTDVFGRLIDRVVGRSSVPLAVIRLGLSLPDRIVFPVSEEHLLPGGGGSLSLAADLTRRLRDRTGHRTTILRTGARTGELPAAITELGDQVHHDPRRTHRAVEAFARPSDLIVAAVAPTASGLRGATTHLAWAAPDATLLVAVDVGPTRGAGLVEAVADAGRPAPARVVEPPAEEVRIVVTVRLPEDDDTSSSRIEEILRTAGETDLLMSWWPASDTRAHVGATVTVRGNSVNAAMARVMTAVHEAPDLRGAEITYDLDRGAPRSVEPAERSATR